MSLVTDDGRRPCLSYAVDEVSLWFCHVWKVERDLFSLQFSLCDRYEDTLFSKSTDRTQDSVLTESIVKSKLVGLSEVLMSCKAEEFKKTF